MVVKSLGSTFKICFFIGGLDEYHGHPEEVTRLISALAALENIEICASSRPHRHYEKTLKRVNRSFDIAVFTQLDMENHARSELSKGERSPALAEIEPDCERIIRDISAWASGV